MILAQMNITGIDIHVLDNDCVDGDYLGTRLDSHYQTVYLVLLQWNCTEIYMPLTDSAYAALLLIAGHSPVALTSLTLGISSPSQDGLEIIRAILQRSALKHLHIRCTVFSLKAEEQILQELASVK